jgi:cytidylate kinase
MNKNFVITIGRQLGSGGREIGEKLAKLLEISFYDKELIFIASKESGLGKEFFEKVDEKRRLPIIGGLFGLKGSMSVEPFSNYYLSNETLFNIQSDIIRKLADKGSSLFVGRCADYVLKDHPRCLNIFISADVQERIKRIAGINNISEDKAAELIEKSDKQRAGYYNYFSDKTWSAIESYHLCINSSVLEIDGTVEMIRLFATRRFGI